MAGIASVGPVELAACTEQAAVEGDIVVLEQVDLAAVADTVQLEVAVDSVGPEGSGPWPDQATVLHSVARTVPVAAFAVQVAGVAEVAEAVEAVEAAEVAEAVEAAEVAEAVEAVEAAEAAEAVEVVVAAA